MHVAAVYEAEASTDFSSAQGNIEPLNEHKGKIGALLEEQWTATQSQAIGLIEDIRAYEKRYFVHRTYLRSNNAELAGMTMTPASVTKTVHPNGNGDNAESELRSTANAVVGTNLACLTAEFQDKEYKFAKRTLDGLLRGDESLRTSLSKLGQFILDVESRSNATTE